MKWFLYWILLVVSSDIARAHSVEQYVISKDGITLFTIIGAGSVEERKIQDAFLDRLIEKLERRDKSIPIYLMCDQFRLFYYQHVQWFATVAYDTLRSPDPAFLEDYLYYRMGSSGSKHIGRYLKPPSDKYKFDLAEPIDLGSSYETTVAPLGLKIMYDYGATDSLTGWDRLYTLTQYAIDHLEEIKRGQRRMIMTYPLTLYDVDMANYKAEVSLLTIDTGLIRNIPLLVFGFDHTNVIETNNKRLYILVGIIALVVVLGVASVWKRKKLAAASG